MNELERFTSITKAVAAIESLGPTFFIDYSIRSKISNQLLEHVIQASCLSDIIKWVGHLPVKEIREEKDVIYDNLTVIRHVPGPISNKIEEDVVPAKEMKGSALSEPCNDEDDIERVVYALEALGSTLKSIIDERGIG